MTTSRLSGLKNMSVAERRRLIAENSDVTENDLVVLDPIDGLSVDKADQMVENAIGVLGIPVGFASNLTVNGRDVLVPMATEEPSVIAAASNLARIARSSGGFHTSSTGPVMRAQIQILDVADPAAARSRLLQARDELLEAANAVDELLVRLGGGAKDIEVHIVEARPTDYVVLHLIVDVRDAMGANAVNTMAETLAPRIAEIAEGRTLMRILSNKADLRLTRAHAVFPAEELGGEEVVDNIVHCSALAEADPYRAATHNKGIMNGITAVVLATGNDTRAVESGVHSHAVRHGRYSSVSRFEKNADGDLVGSIEVPMAVGLVGGATTVHPVAKLAVNILGVTTARELAEIIVATGLAQNVAALRALASEGIQRGHMSLHARNVAVAAGASTSEEVSAVAARLVEEERVRQDFAKEVLEQIRGQ